MKRTIIITLIDKNDKEKLYCIRENVQELQRLKVYKELNQILEFYKCAKFYYSDTDNIKEYYEKLKLPFSNAFIGRW